MSIYVGSSIDGAGFSVFKSDTTPTRKSHGSQYRWCIGPFQTQRGAHYFCDTYPNPHIVMAHDADKLAQRYADIHNRTIGR